ncbi:hypothetical protein TNCV_1154141 [Trichonephila clavipes]|nr:hypothetical protein TNCV_1154141 [Trichonephila clavipes]
MREVSLSSDCRRQLIWRESGTAYRPENIQEKDRYPTCSIMVSPDLNPIENVWDALGRQVSSRNYPPTNKNTLIHALTEEWDKLPQQLLNNVVQSMDSNPSPSAKLLAALTSIPSGWHYCSYQKHDNRSLDRMEAD